MTGYVESLSSGVVTGWVLWSKTPPDLEIVAAGHVFPVTPEWVDRPDVVDVHVDAAPTCGFVISLPRGLRRLLVELGTPALAVRCQKAFLPTSSHWNSDPVTADFAVPDPRRRGPLRLLSYWMRAGISRGKARVHDRASPMVSGLHLEIADEQLSTNTPTVFAGNGVDYRPLVEVAPSRTGWRRFEIPPCIWADPDAAGDATLSIDIGLGERHTSTIDRVSLLEAMSLMSRVGAEDQSAELLAIEHARELASHGPIPEIAISWLAALARRYRCADYLHARLKSGQEPNTANPLAWLNRGMQTFSEEAAEFVGREAELLRDIADRLSLTGSEALELFKRAAPGMIRAGLGDQLLGLFDEETTNRMAAQGNAAPASLALPFLAARGSHAALSAALDALADKPGWLFTECLLECSERIHQSDARTWEKEEFVASLVGLIDKHRWSYWSRVYDLRYVRSLVLWLRNPAELSETVYLDLQFAALRAYATSTDFWHLLLDDGHPDKLPAVLRHGHQIFKSITALPGKLRQGGDIGNELGAWSYLLSLDNHDAFWFGRELALHLGEEGPHEAMVMATMRARDPSMDLRALAQPGARITRPDPEVRETVRRAMTLDRFMARQLPAHFQTHERIGSLLMDLAAGDCDLADCQQACTEASVTIRRSKDPVLALDCVARLNVIAGSTNDDLQKTIAEGCSALIDAVSVEGSPLHHPLFPAMQAAIERGDRRDGTDYAQTLMAGIKRSDALSDGDEYALTRHAPTVSLPAAPPSLDFLRHDVLVAIYSCQPNLDTRVAAIRSTWLAELKRYGIPYVIVVGGGDGQLHGDVLHLAVDDSYESLPAKTLAMVEWVLGNTPAQFLVKIDDDCFLSPKAYFGALAHRRFDYHGKVIRRQIGAMDRTWHQQKAKSDFDKTRLDRSPEPSSYCDGGGGYSLSRAAMEAVCNVAGSTYGKWLTSVSLMEDKLIGDLLGHAGISPSDQAFVLHTLRRTGQMQMPVPMFDNSFECSTSSPTMIMHLDHTGLLVPASENARRSGLRPGKIWPSFLEARLDYNSPQLSLMSSLASVSNSDPYAPVVVAVMRNELVLIPYFLDHYRRMGVAGFCITDNLSDDGTLEYLLRQPDVVVYSTDCQYSESHYGVAWQQAMASQHCMDRWTLFVDSDEFLSSADLPGSGLRDLLQRESARGATCIPARLVDVYPEGRLEDFDLANVAPWEIPLFSDGPPTYEVEGTGYFSNLPANHSSALRRRLMPDSGTELFVANKCPLVRYSPWVRLSDGIHYVGNVTLSERTVDLLHVKYHAGFKTKVDLEVQRGEHYNGAVEYRAYQKVLATGPGGFFRAGVSRPVRF